MERIGNDLRDALRGAGVPDAGQLAAVTDAWPAAVGPAVSRSAWPQRISRDGVLHVATISSTWAQELTLLQEEVVAKLVAALGDEAPPTIRFAVGLVPEPPAVESEGPRPPLVPDEQELAEASALAAPIADLELREAVRRAVAASLAAQRSDTSV